MGILKLKLKG